MSYTRLLPYQAEGVRKMKIFKGRALLCDEMGCVDGDSMVAVNRAKKGFSIRLEDLCRKFRGAESRGKVWDSNIPTYIRALCNEELRQHKISDVLFKGMKKTVELTLLSGKSIRLTPDHEVALANGSWLPAGDLTRGMKVFTNGTPVCRDCGSTDRVATYRYAKYIGLCVSCVHRGKRNGNWNGGKTKDKDGYVIVSDKFGHPRAWPNGQMYEHILVMEEFLGRFILLKEEVHHKNRNKSDNRIENLELLSSREEHSALHGREGGFKNMDGGVGGKGGLVKFIPSVDSVLSVKEGGRRKVYDVVCEDPHRNFVANGIVVHNCGKTLQALDYACQGDYFPAIVVCPSIAKLEWEDQAWRHRKVSSTICSTRKPPHPQLFETEDLVIINYDILKYWVGLLACLKPKLVILDEVHNIANDNSQRTEAVRLLCSGVKRVLALSGTPLVNRPFELWPTLNIIRPDEFKSQFSFGHKWCDPEFTFGRWEFKGCTDPVALNKLLLKTCMIRRTKEEVLDQLPPKRHHMLSLEIKKRKEYEKAEANLISWLAGYDMAAAHRAMRNERFTRFSYLKHLAAQLKLDSVVEWVKEFLLESDGKLLIGTMHRDVLSGLENRVKALTRVVTIQGGKTDKQRKEAEKIFRTHKDCRILIGNMKACGVALNLPEAKAVLLSEFPFAPGTVQQFIDRAHRLTTTHEVDVYYGVGTGTIENLLCRILDRKMKILNQVLDGVEERDGSLPVLEELHNQILKEKGKYRGKASKDF